MNDDFKLPAGEQTKPRRALLLPPNLAALAKLTNDRDTNYTLSGVHLISTETGYRAEATNAKYLGVVSGVMADPETHGAFPSVANADNGAAEVIVPEAVWTEALKSTPKKQANPIERNAVAVIGSDCVTFGTADAGRKRTISTPPLDGRFLDALRVIHDAAKHTQTRVAVDAKLLRELLAVAESFCESGSRVTIELGGPDRPLIVRSQNPEQTFTGLLMPLK